ncbi:MAG: prepilin-type N-terminal cleavage/methylation domain-containing protein [Candidatus Omnitrophica bacterium]|nr:prepilin-type N-terminal cleavage/methylation domain-containing protein [Candidatus Omnitrophota bacterium]
MPIPTSGRSRRRERGATLLEIIIAMVIIAMVAAGIMSAFVFSRQAVLRSGTELSAAGLTRQTVDDLRMAIPQDTLDGLSLVPGIYVDDNMQNIPPGSIRPDPDGPGGPIRNPLNFPPEFVQFQTDPGTPPAGWTVPLEGHGDGRMVVVENAPVDNNPANGQIDPAELNAVDRDGDGQAGQDFDGDGVTDLRRVRVRVRWSSPET